MCTVWWAQEEEMLRDKYGMDRKGCTGIDKKIKITVKIYLCKLGGKH